MFSYDDLMIFTKVVQSEGIVKAAQKLNMNYTTVSRRIKQLEQTFKQPLLSADRHKFLLTEFGNKLYHLIENDIGLMALMKDKIIEEMSPAKEPSGVLNVQLPHVVSLDRFTPYIHEFLLQYPNLNLHIWYQNHDIDLVKENFDVVLLNHPSKLTWQKSRIIHQSRIRLFCTKTYADKYGVPITPMDLSKHIVTGGIIEGQFNKNLSITNTITGEEATIPMPHRIATNSIIHNLALLQSNEMIISAFDDIEKHAIYHELIPVLPDYRMMEIKFYLLKNPYKSSVNIEAFCNFLESCLTR